MHIEVSLNKESPLMPKFIKFKVILQSDLEANSHKQRRSKWLGNLDEDFTNRNSNTKEVLIYANSLTNRYVENIKLENIVYFDRGSANGFTAIWPTNNAKISTRITNVECVK